MVSVVASGFPAAAQVWDHSTHWPGMNHGMLASSGPTDAAWGGTDTMSGMIRLTAREARAAAAETPGFFRGTRPSRVLSYKRAKSRGASPNGGDPRWRALEWPATRKERRMTLHDADNSASRQPARRSASIGAGTSWAVRILMFVVLGAGAYYIMAEHRAHPWAVGLLAFLLLCPLMHSMHGGHGGHGGGERRDGEDNTGDRNG